MENEFTLRAAASTEITKSFDYLSQSDSVLIDSIKRTRTDGVLTKEEALDFDVKDLPEWITSAKEADPSVPNRYKLTLTLQENTGQEPRSATIKLTQKESGEILKIILDQAKYKDPYTFLFSPEQSTKKTLRVPAGGQDTNISIYSFKQVTADIGGWDDTVNLAWKPIETNWYPDWMTGSYTVENLNLKINKNTGSARNYTMKFRQEESEKEITLEIIQEEASAEPTPNYLSYHVDFLRSEDQYDIYDVYFQSEKAVESTVTLEVSIDSAGIATGYSFIINTGETRSPLFEMNANKGVIGELGLLEVISIDPTEDDVYQYKVSMP